MDESSGRSGVSDGGFEKATRQIKMMDKEDGCRVSGHKM
jgi:hypothetical protein